MTFGMSITTFTLLHTLLSIIGIFAGCVVAGGLVAGKRLDGWAAYRRTSSASSRSSCWH